MVAQPGSERTDWICLPSPFLNDRSGDVCWKSPTVVLQKQTNAASARCENRMTARSAQPTLVHCAANGSNEPEVTKLKSYPSLNQPSDRVGFSARAFAAAA
jgi:hypothetical protein